MSSWSNFDWAPEWTRTEGEDPVSRLLAAEKRGHIAGLKEALEIAQSEQCTARIQDGKSPFAYFKGNLRDRIAELGETRK